MSAPKITLKPEIDVALDVIRTVTPYGYTWTLRDLAEVCGCSSQLLHQVEARALRKLRHATRMKLLLDEPHDPDSPVELMKRMEASGACERRPYELSERQIHNLEDSVKKRIRRAA